MAAMVILSKLEVPIKYVRRGVPLVTGNAMDLCSVSNWICVQLPTIFIEFGIAFPQRKFSINRDLKITQQCITFTDKKDFPLQYFQNTLAVVSRYPGITFLSIFVWIFSLKKQVLSRPKKRANIMIINRRREAKFRKKNQVWQKFRLI